jgi:hypothetical protein
VALAAKLVGCRTGERRRGPSQRAGVSQRPNRVMCDVDWSSSGTIAFSAFDSPLEDSKGTAPFGRPTAMIR